MTKDGYYCLVAVRQCGGSGCRHHSASVICRLGHHHKLRVLYCIKLGLQLAHSLDACHLHHPWWEHVGLVGLDPGWEEELRHSTAVSQSCLTQMWGSWADGDSEASSRVSHGAHTKAGGRG